MNRFLVSTIRMISRHGDELVYKSFSNSTYDVELGKSVSSIVEYTLKMYPKQIEASQYQFPNLVGKELIMFYLPNNTTGLKPKEGDVINYKNSDYKVHKIQEHVADGEIVLYRIITVKG